ncbi:Hypothetical predicted protein [Octopus vulgaris]|uniref:Uncharacterized protein n=1 Tax=Octopus vulgaris TaxID=6645 RepID=A0AA36BJT3_OCTVU|nr:Hypothetical predicted protein [Octopus vulgaris]
MDEGLWKELITRYQEDVRDVSTEVAEGKLTVSPAATPTNSPVATPIKSPAATPAKEKDGEGVFGQPPPAQLKFKVAILIAEQVKNNAVET